MGKERQIVLVVDDQMVNREMLKRILRPDYEVLEAENGQSALRLLHNR
jgi:CheY-like chemotaxis protein